MTSRQTIAVVGVALTVSFLLLGLTGFYVAPLIYRILRPRYEVQVTGPIVVPEQWLEIVLNPRLKQDRQRQYIVFVPADRFLNQGPTHEPRLEDGTFVNFEAQLVGDDGKIYPLSDPGGDGYTEIARTFDVKTSESLSPKTSFTRLRVRASPPVRCSQIVWLDFDWRDF